MTEQEWLTCGDPSWMTHYLWAEANERKIRLFGVACCRRMWHILTNRSSRRAVEVVERYADGLATREELINANRKLVRYGGSLLHYSHFVEALYAADLASMSDINVRNFVVTPHRTALAAAHHAHQDISPHDPGWPEATKPVYDSEIAALCILLRHIFGNPFRPYPAPESWPATVTQLANALYNGEDCGFALHDALLEAGHPELAEHFRQEQSHPKGCWVVDVVLGKG